MVVLGVPGRLGGLKFPTSDSGSGHDLAVHEIEPHIRLCADSAEPAWESPSPSLCAPCSRLFSQNKHFFLNGISLHRKKNRSLKTEVLALWRNTIHYFSLPHFTVNQYKPHISSVLKTGL